MAPVFTVAAREAGDADAPTRTDALGARDAAAFAGEVLVEVTLLAVWLVARVAALAGGVDEALRVLDPVEAAGLTPARVGADFTGVDRVETDRAEPDFAEIDVLGFAGLFFAGLKADLSLIESATGS